MAINDYMHYRYVRDARGHDGETIDCWGLVRLVWENEFGKSPLKIFSGVMTPRELSKKYDSERLVFNECYPKNGAIAACFKSRICVHVGIVVDVDGELRVLDINEGSPVSHHSIRKFKNKFTRVIFYDN